MNVLGGLVNDSNETVVQPRVLELLDCEIRIE